jgi:hypothetical protein
MRYILSELDLVFLSYDENQDENWDRVKAFRTDAKRIHGVRGFDRAHKICAEIVNTDRFIIVDGDNWIHDDWLQNTGDISIDDTGVETACFSFSSYNNINGLTYGNGGVKVWNKLTLLNSNTHESGSSIDFCWDIPYYQDNRILSITIQNKFAYNAWRAGFREAVKMTLDDGKPRAQLGNTWQLIHDKNLSRLNVWLSVGRDVKNGIWAILGARQAIYEMMSGNFDFMLINDYTWFNNKWNELIDSTDVFGPETQSHNYNKLLQEHYNFYMPELDAKQSAWFKKTYINPVRKGLMK